MLQDNPNFLGQPLNEGFVTTFWTTWKGDQFFYFFFLKKKKRNLHEEVLGFGSFGPLQKDTMFLAQSSTILCEHQLFLVLE